MIVKCLHCSKEFNKQPSQVRKSPNHYCSHSCSASRNNLGKQKNPPKKRLCKVCGSIYYYSSKHRSKSFCKTCKPQYTGDGRRLYYQSLTLGEYRQRLSVKGKHPSWVNAHCRHFCRSWHKDLAQGSCEVCDTANT